VIALQAVVEGVLLYKQALVKGDLLCKQWWKVICSASSGECRLPILARKNFALVGLEFDT
jgi:hypothetical protein